MNPITFSELVLEEQDIQADIQTTDELQDSVSDASKDSETLEKISDVLEQNPDGLSPSSTQLAEIATESLYRRLGVQKKARPALESMGRKEYVRVALEENGTVIQRVLAALKAAITKIIDFFKSVFSKIKAFIQKVLGFQDHTKKEIGEITKKNAEVIDDAEVISKTQENQPATIKHPEIYKTTETKINVTSEVKQQAETIKENAKKGRDILINREDLIPFMTHAAVLSSWENKKDIPLQEVTDLIGNLLFKRTGYLTNFLRDMERHFKRMELVEKITEKEVEEHPENIFGTLTNTFDTRSSTVSDLSFPLYTQCAILNLHFTEGEGQHNDSLLGKDNVYTHSTISHGYSDQKYDQLSNSDPIRVHVEYTGKEGSVFLKLCDQIKDLCQSANDTEKSISDIIKRFQATINKMEISYSNYLRTNKVSTDEVNSNIELQSQYIKFLNKTLLMTVDIMKRSITADRKAILDATRKIRDLKELLSIA